MKHLFDVYAPKTSVNIAVNSDLLKKSLALHINLTVSLEDALSQQLKEHFQTQWELQNRNANKSYNEFVEAHGCFSDDYRCF